MASFDYFCPSLFDLIEEKWRLDYLRKKKKNRRVDMAPITMNLL